jgi:hypothetical protein
VLFVHPDPLVHDLVAGTLGDEFTVLGARTAEQAARRRPGPAVVVIACEEGLDPEAIVDRLRGADPHVRAVFLVDPRDTSLTWQLASHGTVLPRRQDLDRLRHAIRHAARLHGMASGVERLLADTGVPERGGARTTGKRRATTDRSRGSGELREEASAKTRDGRGRPR